MEVDNVFIIAMVCFGVGAILLIIGMIILCMWYKRHRKDKLNIKRKQRELDISRHLEEYSTRTGGTADAYTKFGTPVSLDNSLNSSAFDWNDVGSNKSYPSSNGDTGTNGKKMANGHSSAMERLETNVRNVEDIMF